jgi:hypothetical protein
MRHPQKMASWAPTSRTGGLGDNPPRLGPLRLSRRSYKGRAREGGSCQLSCHWTLDQRR